MSLVPSGLLYFLSVLRPLFSAPAAGHFRYTTILLVFVSVYVDDVYDDEVDDVDDVDDDEVDEVDEDDDEGGGGVSYDA